MRSLSLSKQEVMDTLNKCDDCCPVRTCGVCGPCPEHDRTYQITYYRARKTFAQSCAEPRRVTTVTATSKDTACNQFSQDNPFLIIETIVSAAD